MSISYFPAAPHTEINKKGEIVYSEVNRNDVRKLKAYVEQMMASADHISDAANIQKIQDDVVKLWNVVKSQPKISEEQKNHIKAPYDNGMVRSLRKTPDSCLWPGVPRSRPSFQFLRPQISSITSVSADNIPLHQALHKCAHNWCRQELHWSRPSIVTQSLPLAHARPSPTVARCRSIHPRRGTHLLALVLLPKPQPDSALRARIEDAYDPTTGHIMSDSPFSGAVTTGLASASER